jgi:hypothetical protein
MANSRSVIRFSGCGRASLVLLLAGCVCWTPISRAGAQDRADGQAPPNMAVLKRTRGGAWFVAKDLKEQYDRLLDQARALQAELERNGLSSQEARLRITGLRNELEKLRREIEQKKLLVSPVKVHRQNETTEFRLGPESLLVITADNIVIEGWDRPNVKCVLEKTVLAAGDVGVEGHLDGLKLVHRHGAFPEIVGTSEAERQAAEQKFLSSPDGQKLTPQQRDARGRLLREIADGYAPYRDFQGREFDLLEIEGLTDEQGNRQVTVGVSSAGGDANLGSEWQRHASVTVYVPRCRTVALRGCLVNLAVDGLNAALVVTGDGSRDRDYDGKFSIRELHGTLTVHNAPLDLIESVSGDVTIVATTELANTGTQHENDQRTSYTPPPRQLVCNQIDGNFTGWFSRVDLQLSRIGGRIDVRNEFGDTTVASPGDEQPHRLLSEVGRVEIVVPRDLVQRLPVSALTNCGTVRTNAPRDLLDDTNFTTSGAGDGARREWRGFQSANRRDPAHLRGAVNRLHAVLTGAERTNGLDLVSRSGTVVVTIEN